MCTFNSETSLFSLHPSIAIRDVLPRIKRALSRVYSQDVFFTEALAEFQHVNCMKLVLRQLP